MPPAERYRIEKARGRVSELLYFHAETPQQAHGSRGGNLAHGVLQRSGEALTLRLPGSVSLSEGDNLELVTDTGALHLFDPDSGRRIADL